MRPYPSSLFIHLSNMYCTPTLTMDENYYLHLTDAGREAAEATYEKHRFFTEMLVAAGVDPVIAERDACRIGHVISKETFERLKAARKLSEKAVISSDES